MQRNIPTQSVLPLQTCVLKPLSQGMTLPSIHLTFLSFKRDYFQKLRKRLFPFEAGALSLHSHLHDDPVDSAPVLKAIDLGQKVKLESMIVYSDSHGLKRTSWFPSYNLTSRRKLLSHFGFFINYIRVKETTYHLTLTSSNQVVSKKLSELVR